ncbi:MAG: sulfite exporter TauE/SafE family protein [Candidatus Ratteibacteria bacterium]
MSNEFIILVGTAATIGFIHTILGPDHYVPFIVLSKVRKWSKRKTTLITLFCGIGHVLSSIILGFVGIALGVAVLKLESIESFRGDLSTWFLIIFGFTYFAWGLRQAFLRKSHEHFHQHQTGNAHAHSHKHIGDHVHIHNTEAKSLTMWVLFIIFVLGPCEPLIPLVMYPAARGNMTQVVLVALSFGLLTIATMLTVVLISFYGLSKLPFHKFEKYSHALAGLVVFLCGIAVKFLGL